MFVGKTSDWIDAPGVPNTEMYLTSSLGNTDKVFHPAFTSEFETFAVKMHEWAEKGYWGKDVLSSARMTRIIFIMDYQLPTSAISQTGQVPMEHKKRNYPMLKQNSTLLQKLQIKLNGKWV